MDAVMSDRVLDLLRQIGDRPTLQSLVHDNNGVVADIVQRRFGDPIVAGTMEYGVVEEYRKKLGEVKPFWLDPKKQLNPDKIEQASALFSRYGTEIGAALLLAALPEAYAASFGAKVLYRVSDLARHSDDFLTRRITGTAQFLVNVMMAPPVTLRSASSQKLDPPALQIAKGLWAFEPTEKRGRALDNAIALRLRHTYVRQVANDNAGRIVQGLPAGRKYVFLNQEDLLGTLLSFSVTVFEVLEQFGITWTADEQEAYLYAWDVVGHYLGIGDVWVIGRLRPPDVQPAATESHGTEASEAQASETQASETQASETQASETQAPVDEVLDTRDLTPEDHAFLDAAAHKQTLRPQTVSEARNLLAKIRARVWEDPWHDQPNFSRAFNDMKAGRLLLRALVEDIGTAMPPSRQLWPIRVIRELAPAPVSDRLALGGMQAQDLFSTTLPMTRAVVGRFTSVDRTNPVGGLMLRGMATDIVDRYFTKLVHGGFTMPDLQFSPTLSSKR